MECKLGAHTATIVARKHKSFHRLLNRPRKHEMSWTQWLGVARNCGTISNAASNCKPRRGKTHSNISCQLGAHTATIVARSHNYRVLNRPRKHEMSWMQWLGVVLPSRPQSWYILGRSLQLQATNRNDSELPI